MRLYNVSFPGLGINLKINPLALDLEIIKINWYGIIIAVSFLAAYLYINSRAKEFGVDKEKLLDVIICGAFSGIIGARAYYVIFYPGDFYKNNPWRILDIASGGIAIYGAIIGGLLGAFIILLYKKMKVWPVFDLAALGLLIGQAIGRWGNFFNQEAFGTITRLPWGMMSENTSNQTVHPCFLYESIWCLIGFLILHVYSKNKKERPDGEIFCLYVLWYGLGRTFIEGLRTDSLMIPFLGLRVSQLVAILSCLVASMVLIKIIKSKTY